MTVIKGLDKAKAWQAAHPHPSKDDPCTLAIGALPRSGKSYMAAGLIHSYNLQLQAQGQLQGRGARALVYTTQPTETGNTWTDVLSGHQEFDTSAGSMNSMEWESIGIMPAAASGGNNPEQNQNQLSYQPASWIVMSKQAFDNGNARGLANRSRSRAPAAGPAASAHEGDGDTMADDEIYAIAEDGSAGGVGSSCSSKLTAAAGFGSGASGYKVIACDELTRSQWAATNTQKPSFEDVVGTGFDVILFDEAHLGSTSQLSKEAIKQLMAGPHTLLVLITATYVRPVGGYSVPPDHLLCWSLLDVGFAREGNLKAIAEAHGADYVQGALRYCGIIPPNQVNQCWHKIGQDLLELDIYMIET